MTDEELAGIEARAVADEQPGAVYGAEEIQLMADRDALLAEVRRLRVRLPELFDAGFAESAEGWNNEWPREFDAEDKKRYEAARAVAVAEALKADG